MLAKAGVMQPSELLRAISTVAQAGGTPAQCETLAHATARLADMVGWASGPIDAGGRLLERLAALQDDLRLRHAHSGEPSLKLLHDALADLGRAIVRHDEDLAADGAGEDEGEDFT